VTEGWVEEVLLSGKEHQGIPIDLPDVEKLAQPSSHIVMAAAPIQEIARANKRTRRCDTCVS